VSELVWEPAGLQSHGTIFRTNAQVVQQMDWELVKALFMVLFTAGLIWGVSDLLQRSARSLGARLRLPDSVMGAVFYAIPSSMPEFCIAVIAVLFIDKSGFSIGVGTVAGSAVYNVLVIPALSVLFAAAAARKRKKKDLPGAQVFERIVVTKHVLKRDGLTYFLVVVLLAALVVPLGMSKWLAVLFLFCYLGYVGLLWRDAHRHRKTEASRQVRDDVWPLGKAIAILILAMVITGVACYFLVEATVDISTKLSIHPYVVAVLVTAAATSIPDTAISVLAARDEGEESEESIVNAFSSNIFDILVCLSVPALLVTGTVNIDASESGVTIGLLALFTIITLAVMRKSRGLTVKGSYALLGMYVAFVLSAIFNHQILGTLGLE